MCSRMHISAHALPSVVKYRGDLFERQEVCLIKATHEKKEQKTLLQYLLFLATYYWFSVFAILWAGHLVPGPLQKVMAFSLRLQTHRKQKDGCKKREMIHTQRMERKRKTIEKRKEKEKKTVDPSFSPPYSLQLISPSRSPGKPLMENMETLVKVDIFTRNRVRKETDQGKG